MRLKYINRIKANFAIHSHKKSTNILDGTYKSVYKGKSMNFENLREYVLGDDAKDIDWKSSARSGSLLVRQYIAEKKHNIMLVMDTGVKMGADTSAHEPKSEIALYAAGAVGYLAIKNDDYVGMVYGDQRKIVCHPLKYSLYSLEKYLTFYAENAVGESNFSLDDVLKFVARNFKKRMIIFVISDLEGIESCQSRVFKELHENHDVLVINIGDNFMMGQDVFDVEKDEYISPVFLQDRKLHQIEKDLRRQVLEKCQEKLRRNRINMVTIDAVSEINSQIVRLLEMHKNVGVN